MFGSEKESAAWLGEEMLEKVGRLGQEVETLHLQKSTLQKTLKAQETRETQLIRTNTLRETVIEDQKRIISSLQSRVSEGSFKNRELLSLGFYLARLFSQGRYCLGAVLKLVQKGISGETVEETTLNSLKKHIEDFDMIDKSKLKILFCDLQTNSDGLLARDETCLKNLEGLLNGESNLAKLYEPLCWRFRCNLKHNRVLVDEDVNLSQELKRLLNHHNSQVSNSRLGLSLAREDQSKNSSLIIEMPNCSSLFIPEEEANLSASFDLSQGVGQQNCNLHKRTHSSSELPLLNPGTTKAQPQPQPNVLSLVTYF